MFRRLMSRLSFDKSVSEPLKDIEEEESPDVVKSDVKPEGLTEEDIEILSPYFDSDGEVLTPSLKLLHGGMVNFQFFPLLDKAMWFQIAERVGPKSDYSNRSYLSEFRVKNRANLLRLSVDNTAPLARKLRCSSPCSVDRKLSLYLADKDFDGFISLSGKNVLLLNPARYVEPVSFDPEKNFEFLAFCQKIEATEPRQIEINSKTKIIGAEGKFRPTSNLSVWCIPYEISKNLPKGQSEEFLYHFTQIKRLHNDCEQTFCVIDHPEGLYFVNAELAERYNFIQKLK